MVFGGYFVNAGIDSCSLNAIMVRNDNALSEKSRVCAVMLTRLTRMHTHIHLHVCYSNGFCLQAVILCVVCICVCARVRVEIESGLIAVDWLEYFSV